MKDTEIEIQVNIEKNESLINFLKKNATFKGKVHQVDDYFTPPHRDFLKPRPVKEWLRLRSSDNSQFITYKHWHFDDQGKSHYCDEYETRIDDLNQTRKILKVLNFIHLVRVDKKRKTWLYKDYKITFDSVDKLGDFVEIEYQGKNYESPDKITQEMVRFLKKRGCGVLKRNYVGYPFQLLFPEEFKYEEL